MSLCTAALVSVGPAAEAGAEERARSAAPAWRDCADGFQCATVRVPRDYRRPGGASVPLRLVRLPATDPTRRIGSLFLNPGGPGGSGVEFVRSNARGVFAPLTTRFDLVGWDPRGVGTVDCKVDQEKLGISAQPFGRPTRASERLLVRRARSYVRRCVRRAPRALLPHLHSANAARDLNRLRAAVGDESLSFLGYSYGTQLGATYATLFPRRIRALVLDGAVDVEGYVRRPIQDVRRQTAGYEDAFDRFVAACRLRPDRCGLGTNPRAGWQTLAKRLDRTSIPAPGSSTRLPVDGDDLRAATLAGLNQKGLWPVLSSALVQAQSGDGTLLRTIADVYYEHGTPTILDPFVAITAVDLSWPSRIAPYLRDGRSAHRRYPHFWWNAGYSEIAMALWPAEPRNGYSGPVSNARRATTTLVVGTTHDPATPYVWAKRLTGDLGNARLLTMRGDGHTASFNAASACIDTAVQAYLESLTLPRKGTVCDQEVPFTLRRAAPRRTLRELLLDARLRAFAR